ncbi:hydroxyacid dehydrogenase [Candidatus Poribacteria bacterium]
MDKPKVVSVMSKGMYSSVMSEEAEKKLISFANLVKNEKDSVPSETEMCEMLEDADGCITGWGAKLTEPVIEAARKLKIIGHAAGSVKAVVPALAYERDIVVTHAAATIALSVGEMCLGFAIAGLRNFIQHDTAFKQDGTRGDKTIPRLIEDKGLYGARVGIIGASMTGRQFIKLLKAFDSDVEIWVYDPYLTEAGASDLGASKVPLKQLLSRCDVISLNCAATPETRHMIGKEEVKLIKDGAVLINSARGALIDFNGILDELRTGRFRACFDVYLETLSDDEIEVSEYRKLRNVLFTPGIAGPAGRVRRRLGGTIVEDFALFFSGKEPKHRVVLDLMPSMA